VGVLPELLELPQPAITSPAAASAAGASHLFLIAFLRSLLGHSDTPST
jgi:hypothetical protein